MFTVELFIGWAMAGMHEAHNKFGQEWISFQSGL
jgi:hypothetical protein